MAQTDIDGAIASDLNNQVEDYEVNRETTDGPDGEKEFSWQLQNWTEYLGYYKNIPELQTAIDAKTKWTMGAGFEADELTTMLLNTIKGNGRDSFNSILANQDRIRRLAGVSFAEIIRDQKGLMVNLKPLDPSSIVIVFNSKGIIQKYEQVNKYKDVIRTFRPQEIFHLDRNRAADEVHGISIIPAVKWIIDARNEAMNDWKRVLHRNVDPLWVFHLDTDDSTEIAAFKAKNDAARANGENMYIPKGVVVPELVATATNASLNPLTWINQLNDYFYQVVNVPQIIVGNAKEFTDASGKIVYLAFEQSVKTAQLYLEEQVLNQLNILIHLTFPASLENEAISDKPSETTNIEEEPMEPPIQPNDKKTEMEGKE